MSLKGAYSFLTLSFFKIDHYALILTNSMSIGNPRLSINHKFRNLKVKKLKYQKRLDIGIQVRIMMSSGQDPTPHPPKNILICKILPRVFYVITLVISDKAKTRVLCSCHLLTSYSFRTRVLCSYGLSGSDIFSEKFSNKPLSIQGSLLFQCW